MCQCINNKQGKYRISDQDQKLTGIKIMIESRTRNFGGLARRLEKLTFPTNPESKQ